MRHLFIHVPVQHCSQVVAFADQQDARNLVTWQASSRDETVAVVSLSMSNRRISRFLGDVQSLPNVQITFAPQGVFALHPPPSETPDQVTNVQDRSPIEVFLGGLQSIGSWQGFLGYAVAGGIAAWIGLFTDTVIMLIASMLIAPFAGPAMNLALASAHGDLHLLRRSLLRYFSAISVGIVTAVILSFVLQQDVVTDSMATVGKVSVIAALIPLVAGAAGALNLIQSERSSLVSGTATGLLIAATLAPPTALVGMAAVVGTWGLVMTGIFLLLLQLFGLHVSGSLVFRFYGEASHKDSRFTRGKPWVFPVSLGVSVVVLAGLLFWQFTGSPDLFRATREQRAEAEVQQILSQSEWAYLVEANLRFTQPSISNQDTLLGTIYVQRNQNVDVPTELIDQQLTAQIEDRLIQQFSVTPLLDLQVMVVPTEARSQSSSSP